MSFERKSCAKLISPDLTRTNPSSKLDLIPNFRPHRLMSQGRRPLPPKRASDRNSMSCCLWVFALARRDVAVRGATNTPGDQHERASIKTGMATSTETSKRDQHESGRRVKITALRLPSIPRRHSNSSPTESRGSRKK